MSQFLAQECPPQSTTATPPITGPGRGCCGFPNAKSEEVPSWKMAAEDKSKEVEYDLVHSSGEESSSEEEEIMPVKNTPREFDLAAAVMAPAQSHYTGASTFHGFVFQFLTRCLFDML